MTDRLLPRLQLKPEHKPYLLRFTPYNREQMLSIVNDRYVLSSLILLSSSSSIQLGFHRIIRSKCSDALRQ